MVRTMGSFVGISKSTEMLVMTVIALWVNIFDMAIFEISSNLEQVWNVEMDPSMFQVKTEYIIRMLLSGVVFVRTFTLHLYIAFLIAVFWPICCGTRPTLMLPWLLVSAIKNIGTGLVSMVTGGYTCIIYGPLRPACLRFLASQMVDLSPSFYMWLVGLSFYRDLKKPIAINRTFIKAIEEQELNVLLRRRKVKSMINEDILRQQYESRSFQKKYFGTSAVEVNEILNPCTYENLNKNYSRSLDSLLDVLTVQTELFDIEDTTPSETSNNLTVQEKTAKLLGMSISEIDIIKQSRLSPKSTYPLHAQRKIIRISKKMSKYESPAKLLPQTSLYTPSIKAIRAIKSEVYFPNEFLKVHSPSEFIQNVPEQELQTIDLSYNEKYAFVSLTCPLQKSNRINTNLEITTDSKIIEKTETDCKEILNKIHFFGECSKSLDSADKPFLKWPTKDLPSRTHEKLASYKNYLINYSFGLTRKSFLPIPKFFIREKKDKNLIIATKSLHIFEENKNVVLVDKSTEFNDNFCTLPKKSISNNDIPDLTNNLSSIEAKFAQNSLNLNLSNLFDFSKQHIKENLPTTTRSSPLKKNDFIFDKIQRSTIRTENSILKPEKEIMCNLINQVASENDKQNNVDQDQCDKSPSNEYDIPQLDLTKTVIIPKDTSNFSCQASTISRKLLSSNPSELSKACSSKKPPITKENKRPNSQKSSKSNSSRVERSQTPRSDYGSNRIFNQKVSPVKLETNNKTTRRNSLKKSTEQSNTISDNDEQQIYKRDKIVSPVNNSRTPKSYIKIHQGRLGKAKNTDQDDFKLEIKQSNAFLEDGYSRMFNLLKIKNPFSEKKIKNPQKLNSSVKF